MAMYADNEDWRAATRMASDEAAFGITLYEGAYDPETSNWTGRVIGNVGDVDAAKRWVDTGEEPQRMLRAKSPGSWL